MIDTENTQSRGENMDNVDTLPMDVESVDDYLAKETFTYICYIWICKYDYMHITSSLVSKSLLCKSSSYRKS